MDGIIDSMDTSLCKLQETGKPGVLQSIGPQRVRHNLATEQQQSPLLEKGRREEAVGAKRSYVTKRTWVHSPANPLAPGCSKGKCSVYCRMPSKAARQLMGQKIQTFRERFLKTE